MATGTERGRGPHGRQSWCLCGIRLGVELFPVKRVSSAFKRDTVHVVGSRVPGKGVSQASTNPFSSRRRVRHIVLLDPMVVAVTGIHSVWIHVELCAL